MKKFAKRTLSFFLLLILFMLIPLNGFSQQSSIITKGIEEYKDESYEESIVTLTKARVEEPESSVAAFFLGMAYKQTMDYEKSLKNLLDAVSLTPRIKEALVEVVDVSIQLKKLDIAKKWIAVAEKENIFPAKIAFLKGLIFNGEGKNREAAESFEKAKSIDPDVSQAADFQIALSYVKERRLNDAKQSFEAAIVSDPQSDLAGYARQYLDSVEQRIGNQKPWRFTFQLFGFYDDNMVLKPDPNNQVSVTGITNEESTGVNTVFLANYTPRLDGSWLFNAQYAFAWRLNDKNRDTHDSMFNSISLTPGYNFGEYALYLSTTYNHAMVNPDYGNYSCSYNIGPLYRALIKENQLIEIFAGYTYNNYFKDPLVPEENRDAIGYRSYISWLWLFKKDYFLNLRFQVDRQNADGSNWDNSNFGLSVNYAMPIYENITLQLSGKYNDQKFDNPHSVFDDLTREDKVLVFTGGVAYKWDNGMSLVAQCRRTSADSNVVIYDYTRNMFTIGLEARF